jgi:hypothetical protein
VVEAAPRPRPSPLPAPGRAGRQPTAPAPRRRRGRPGGGRAALPAVGCRGLGDLEVEAAAGGDDPCFADLGATHGVGVGQGPLLHTDRGVAVWSPLVDLPGLLRGPDGQDGDVGLVVAPRVPLQWCTGRVSLAWGRRLHPPAPTSSPRPLRCRPMPTPGRANSHSCLSPPSQKAKGDGCIVVAFVPWPASTFRIGALNLTDTRDDIRGSMLLNHA